MPGERVAVGVCLAVGVAGGATACSAVLGIQDPIPVGFFDGGLFDVVVTDSTRPSDGAGGGDVTVDVPPYETGPCPPMSPDPTQSIFVATGVGSDSADCGSPMAPCQTVQVGVNRARTVGRPLVYLNRGVYSESVMLAAGVTIQGGWDDFGGNWTKNCDPTAAVVQAPPTSNVTFTADTLGGTAALDTLTVLSKGASDVGAGESIFGIMALNASTTLNLATVLVRVVDGGSGAVGTTGPDGTPGPVGGCSPSGTGSNGTQGPPGSGALVGTFSAQGYASNPGGPGTSGGGGDNGPLGFNNGCSSCGSCGLDMTGTCVFTPDGSSTCSYGGLGGCGGGGGTGGGGGGGGGSSLALFAWDATVNATGGTLQSGNGGAGGDGGFGGASGPGGPGGDGSADPACTTACDVSCNPLLNGLQPGGPGGGGGNGGIGGQGGGGAGGMSYAVVQGGAASVNLTSVQLLHGQAGPGGNVGGAPGNSGDHYP